MLSSLQYTFPTEARFATDTVFALDVYSRLVRRLVAVGTTCVLLFATLHQQPCRLLADIVEAAGLRAYVGKVRRQQVASMWAQWTVGVV